MKGFLRVFDCIRKVFLTTILAGLLLIIVLTMITRLTSGTPSAFGFSLYRVSSGSMEPEFQVGDVILSQECDPMTLRNGDVITFDGKHGDLSGKIVTHRVIKAPFLDCGEYYITTKGDANRFADEDIKIGDVRGKVLCKVSILTAIYSFFVTPWGLIITILLIILAFFNEIVNFVKAVTGIGLKKQVTIEDIINKYKDSNDASDDSESENNDNSV